MNGTTLRTLLRCGYSLSSKHVFGPASTYRILVSQTVRRDYCAALSLHQKKNSLPASAIAAQHCNLNSLLVTNHRYLSTTSKQNGQTALKRKTPDREDSKKSTKDKAKAITSDKVAAHTKNDSETEKSTAKSETAEVDQPEEKLTLTAKFKKMYKDYWYVLLPVHIATSTVWLGGFYYLSTSGVDIPSILQTMHFSESTVASLKDSSMGHVAIAYLCYKIATPVRYTVTLGGTHYAIKYLSQWGYIRPVPTKAQLKQMYDDKFNLKEKKD